MGTAPQLSFGHKFSVPAGLLDDGNEAFIDVTLESDADVVQALAGNTAFPGRPKIELGRIRLAATTGKAITFADAGMKVQCTASAGVRAGIGIYNDAQEAVKELGIVDAPGLDLSLQAEVDSHRYLVMSWGYNVAGSVSGSHPIGALGSLTFGVEGKKDSIYAVLHRFERTQGAHEVIAETARSWQLPRQVRTAADLAAGTWLVVETEGQVAANIGARLGYDFSFIREARSLSLTGDIGLKLDASLKATLGLEVSGRYLVILGREEQSEKLRLRLLKLNKKGLAFGLNLAVGVKGVADALPDSVDDFVQAVFGIHGRQVVKDLLVVEKWTDPAQDLSDTAAGLANKTGLELLKSATGVDPAAAFAEAREQLLSALRQWDALPERVAAATWSAIEKSTGPELGKLQEFLAKIANFDKASRGTGIAEIVKDAGSGVIPEAGPAAEWLEAIAERGLISLTDRAEELQESARMVSGILAVGTIQRLQAFIAERLKLDKVRNAITKADFEEIDGWLVKRLSQFLDEEFQFEKLEQVRNTIGAIVRKRQEIYTAARNALERRYSIDVAADYAKTTAKSAVIDVTFDMAEPSAAPLLAAVLKDAAFDGVLTGPTPGVTLNTALLTHGIDRSSSVEVNMPFLSFRQDHVNNSLANLRAEDRGSRVAVYELHASDTVTVRNRLRSELAVDAIIPFPHAGNIRIGESSTTWSYEYASAHSNMRRSDLEARVSPFIKKYLPDQFSAGGASSLSTWFSDLDRAVEDVVANGSNEFGDTILAMDVSVPGTALQSWFRRRSDLQLRAASMEMSRALQAALKELIPFYYFQDVDRLRQNPTVAALLTWAAIPPSTSVRLEGGTLRTNTDKQVFWDYPEPDVRRAMARSPLTAARLAPLLAAARERLLDAGQAHEASFFVPSETGDFQEAASNGSGDGLLSALLRFEANVVEQAAEALRDVNQFANIAAEAPGRAIERLAEMGASITEAFHGKLSTIYGGHPLRTLGSLVFLEAARALDPSQQGTRPNAMLRITVLKEQRQFVLADYLKGARPGAEDIALVQTLTSLAG